MLESGSQTALDAMPYLDESAMCKHSNHGDPGWAHHHHGPATHYVHVLHDCPGDPNAKNLVYPCCVRFAQYVASKGDEPWMCPECKEIHMGDEVVRVVASIKGTS